MICAVVGIDSQGQGSILGHVAIGIILHLSDLVNPSQEGVNVDDGVFIDLSQTALGTDGGSGSVCVDFDGAVIHLTVGVGGKGLFGNAEVISHITDLHSGGVGSQGLFLDGSIEVILVGLITVVLHGTIPIGAALGIPDGSGTAPNIVVIHNSQVKDLLAQGRSGGGAGTVRTSSGRVPDGVNLNGLKDQLSHQLTGSGLGQVGVGVQIVQQALLTGGGSHTEGPLVAGVLVVLVITHSTQDHGQHLVPGHLLIGTKGVRGEALDVLGVAAVVDIAGEPVVSVDVIEQILANKLADLAVGDVAGSSTIDHRGHLCAVDVTLRQETAVIVTLNDSHPGQDFCCLCIVVRELILIREGSRPSAHDHDRQQHSHAKHQAQNLLLGASLGFQGVSLRFPTGFPFSSHEKTALEMFSRAGHQMAGYM